jgi:hypothetical protein
VISQFRRYRTRLAQLTAVQNAGCSLPDANGALHPPSAYGAEEHPAKRVRERRFSAADETTTTPRLRAKTNSLARTEPPWAGGALTGTGFDLRCENFPYWYRGDEVQKPVAEAAKALYERTDELAVLLARAITRDSWSSSLMLGCRCRGAAQIAHAEQHRYVSAYMGGCLQWRAVQWQFSER